ncbi:MAG: hypothetical protein M3157_08315 [Actinomycetota bacterium]|nr:hypothetical protein [Actinomycetota bacterium]
MRLWMAALGGESFYEQDLPACCRRDARGSEGFFECPSCGAVWQIGMAVEPEECAFAERTGEERKGAA